jgi:hypothetical protein
MKFLTPELSDFTRFLALRSSRKLYFAKSFQVLKLLKHFPLILMLEIYTYTLPFINLIILSYSSAFGEEDFNSIFNKESYKYTEYRISLVS